MAMVLLGTGMAQAAASAGPEKMAVAKSAVPAATLSLDGATVAAGGGYVWHQGTLRYRDRERRFDLDGISIVKARAGEVSAEGEVYNLARLSDFDGHYVAVAGSEGAAETSTAYVITAYVMNEHGVIIKLHLKMAGLRFTFAADGAHLRLQGQS
jgi:hypothetical protein